MKKIDETHVLREQATIITETMSISGNIESDQLIIIEGKVLGNITTKNALETSPSSFILGDIQAHSAMLSGEIQGNVSCDESISIDFNTKVTGNIKAKTIKIAGVLIGSANAFQSIALKEKAIVEGNISCELISIESGAKIDGNLKMITPSTPIDSFVIQEHLDEELIDLTETN